MKKIGFSIVLAGFLCSGLSASGVPVGDGANLSQNLTSYIKQVADFIQTQAQWAKENADRTLQQVNQVKQTIAQGQQWINDKIDDSKQWIDETGINDLRREIDDIQRAYDDGLDEYNKFRRIGTDWKSRIGYFDKKIADGMNNKDFDDLFGKGHNIDINKVCEPNRFSNGNSNEKVWSEQYEGEEGVCKQKFVTYAKKKELIRSCKKSADDIKESVDKAFNTAMRSEKREVSYGGGSGTGAGLTTTTIEGGSSKKTADVSLQLAYHAQELQRVKDYCEDRMKQLELDDKQNAAEEVSVEQARSVLEKNSNRKDSLYSADVDYLRSVDENLRKKK